MQLDHKASKILVTGKSGTGKSSYYTRYILNAKHRYVFIFDHEGEFSHRTGSQAGFSTLDLQQQLPSGLVVFDPSEVWPGQTPAAFSFFCEWVFEVCKHLPGEKLFCCDELQKMIDPHFVPWEASCLLETGRRRGLDAIFVTHSPKRINDQVREQLTEVVTFAHESVHAIDWLEDYGFDGNEIKALRVGDYLLKTDAGEKRAGNVFKMQRT